MKLMLALRHLYNWLPPNSWAQVYAVILSLLFLFLLAAWLLDCIKGALP